jgi:hypothetical protein
MNRPEARWLIVALSSALVAWFLIRRRETLIQTVPEFVEERIVLPMGDLMRENFGTRPPDQVSSSERMTRKVGRNRKISVYGKLYGPLDHDLIGQQVEVEEREGTFVVWSGSQEVGTFARQH